MDWFEITGLLFLGAGGAFAAYIGVRNDPRLVRHSWERSVLTLLGVGAWVASILMLMGFP